jgi:hypothetical protein
LAVGGTGTREIDTETAISRISKASSGQPLTFNGSITLKPYSFPASRPLIAGNEMLNRDRYLIIPEWEFDGETSEYFALSEFPFPEDLVEVSPDKRFIERMNTLPNKCFHNALRWAKMSHDYPEVGNYDVVFCYIASAGIFTPHAIVERDGEYFEVTPGVEPKTTKYYRYASISYQAYLAEMREQVRVDFDPMKHHFNPISANKDGLFVFVKDTAFDDQGGGVQSHPISEVEDERVDHRNGPAPVATNIMSRIIKFIFSRRRQ